jgi:AAT family amino acid transporter
VATSAETDHHYEELDKIWLEERSLSNSFAQPLRGLLGFFLSFGFFMALWYVTMDPRGILQWYTPMYGYMYIRWLLIVAIWQAYIFNFWPFKQKWVEETHPLVKGPIMIGINWAITGAIIWIGFFWLIGKYSIPYFSWPELHKVGMTDFFAREYAGLAVLMVAAIASWLAPIWPMAFENYPWHNLTQPAKGITVLCITSLLTIFVYFVFMHPHYMVLFYPWQKFVAAMPWWYESAKTLSGNYNVGWIMCGTIAVWLIETIWERYPFRLIKSQPWRGLAGFAWVLFVALIMFNTFNLMQDLAWGPAYEGGKRLYAPDWRYLHSGELAVMMLLPALVLYFYFDNWPKKFSTEVNLAIRTIIVVVGTFAFNYIYYQISPPLLGTQPGYSHPQQFPMAPVILWIVIMLYHNWFMDGWPGKRIKKD